MGVDRLVNGGSSNTAVPIFRGDSQYFKSQDDLLMKIFYDNGEYAGKAMKSEAHKNGLIHQAVNFAIFNPQGHIYLNQRSQEKISYQGQWGLVMDGHIFPTENPKSVVMKTLIKKASILETDIRFITSFENRHDPNDKENIALYAVVTDQIPILDPKESTNGFFVPIEHYMDLKKSKLFLPGSDFLYETFRIH